MTTSRANLDALIPQYRSKLEKRWADEGPVYIGAEFDTRVVWEKYEPFNLRLGGHYWKPDFMYVLETGHQVIVEVKSTRKHKGFPTSYIKLKEAAAQFPIWTFVLAVSVRGGWDLEIIEI